MTSDDARQQLTQLRQRRRAPIDADRPVPIRSVDARVVHPRRVWRVRWTRPAWNTYLRGGRRHNVRWYSTEQGANRRARKLLNDGAEVEVSQYRLDLATTRRMVLAPPEES